MSAFEKVDQAHEFVEFHHKKNKLKVLMRKQSLTPVVGFMVTYLVGSRHEALGHTGSAHLLEHLMFKGSKGFNKQLSNNIDTLEDVGAALNATTWNDRTNYYAVLPQQYLERVIAIEADRMRHAFIDETDRQSEMTVVRNEFECDENDPFSLLLKHMWATAYQAHPYHHATIGWRSDIENVSIEQLKSFYHTYYWPNNAYLTVYGDYEETKTLHMIEQYFGKIEASNHAIPKPYTQEPVQQGQRRFELCRAGQPGIVGLAFHAPKGTDDDHIVLQLLAQVLSGGRSSRLYQEFINKGLATQYYVDAHPFHDNGLFGLYIWLIPGVDHAKVEEILWSMIESVKSRAVTKVELERAKHQLLAEKVYQNDGFMPLLSAVNESIAIGDWKYMLDFSDKVKAISSEQVKKIAGKYLTRMKSTVGYFIPQNT
ncbi:MAG TPA: pitrilysin family protein [Gammaproteobacteria bacterium]|nr:pitrilysin family protein [Gammaproteobacteria bacterium]